MDECLTCKKNVNSSNQCMIQPDLITTDGNVMNTARVYPLSTDSDLQIFRTLLREYGQHLIRAHGTEHLDLARFEEEIAGLPEPYTIILLAAVTGPGDSSSVVGCIAAKPIKPADSPE